MKQRVTWVVIALFYLSTLGWAAPNARFNNVTVDNNLSIPDNVLSRAKLKWGSGATQLPRYYDNSAFTDNLTLYGNDLIVKEGPWVDVRAFGAVASDSLPSSAIQTANVTYLKNVIDNATASGYVWVDLGGKTYYVNDTVMAQDHYATPVKVRNGRIYGTNIAGPVIDFGGSKTVLDSITIQSDNCYSAVWHYRTTSYGGGSNYWYRSYFRGTATQVLVYKIGQEVDESIDCDYIQFSDAPIIIEAVKNFLNLTMPNLNASYAYGSGGGSTKVGIYRGGMIASYLGAGATSATKVVWLYGANQRTFDGVYFYVPGASEGIAVGNYSESLGSENIGIINNTFEGSGVYVRGQYVLQAITLINNSMYNTSTPFVIDNNSSLSNSIIIGNVFKSITTPTLTFGGLQSTRIYQPDTNIVVNGQGAYNRIDANKVTIVGNDYYNSIYEYRTDGTDSDASVGNRNIKFILNTAEPSAYTYKHGTFLFPDGDTWNPIGLKYMPAVNLKAGLGQPGYHNWFQFIMQGGIAAPATKTSRCTPGEVFTGDASYFYYCISDNNWRRTAIDNTW